MGRSALWQDPWWEDALLWTLTARDVLMQASRFITDWRKFWDIWHQSELKRRSMNVGSEQKQCECLWVSWKPDCVSDYCWTSDSHSQADFILPSVTNREQQKTDDTQDPDGRCLCVSCWLSCSQRKCFIWLITCTKRSFLQQMCEEQELFFPKLRGCFVISRSSKEVKPTLQYSHLQPLYTFTALHLCDSYSYFLTLLTCSTGL